MNLFEDGVQCLNPWISLNGGFGNTVVRAWRCLDLKGRFVFVFGDLGCLDVGWKLQINNPFGVRILFIFEVFKLCPVDHEEPFLPGFPWASLFLEPAALCYGLIALWHLWHVGISRSSEMETVYNQITWVAKGGREKGGKEENPKKNLLNSKKQIVLAFLFAFVAIPKMENPIYPLKCCIFGEKGRGLGMLPCTRGSSFFSRDKRYSGFDKGYHWESSHRRRAKQAQRNALQFLSQRSKIDALFSL